MGTLKDIARSLETIVIELRLLRTSKQVPEGAKPISKPRKYNGKRVWTVKDDAQLKNMRKMGWDYNTIAKSLNRTPSACSAHYWALTKRNK